MLTIVPSVVPEWSQARSSAQSVAMVLVVSNVPSVAEADPVYQEVKQQVKELEEVAEKMESEPAAEKEFSLKLASLNDSMQRMQPPRDSTPQMQRTFYSARDVLRKSKVLVKTQVRCGWVCNYCGCTHTCPNECVEPQLGGTWLYDTVTEEKEIETWTKE